MRRTGKTTRLVNHAVEMLFKHKEICIPSKSFMSTEYSEEENRFKGIRIEDNEKYIFEEDWEIGISQKYLFNRIIKRLDCEHDLRSFKINRDKRTIKLIGNGF